MSAFPLFVLSVWNSAVCASVRDDCTEQSRLVAAGISTADLSLLAQKLPKLVATDVPLGILGRESWIPLQHSVESPTLSDKSCSCVMRGASRIWN